MIDPKFKDKIEELIVILNSKKLEMRLIQTDRSPMKQGKYWRRGRSKEIIEKKIKRLKTKGAKYLAKCIEIHGPQAGPKQVTWVIPGYSWHQWGLAADFAWYWEGKLVKNADESRDGIQGYKVLTDEAVKLGMGGGYYWEKQDGGHVQYYHDKKVSELYSLKQVNDKMEEMHGTKEYVESLVEEEFCFH